MREEVLKRRAKKMRKEPTPSEKRLWTLLRNRRFAEFKFRRQQPVGNYIVDFYCSAAKLIVEMDGESHVGKEKLDQSRSRWLECNGYKVLQVWDTELYENQDGLLQAIWNECSARSTQPLSPGGRGPT